MKDDLSNTSNSEDLKNNNKKEKDQLMVDRMSSPNADDDIEDGELPEEGEICDDEEEDTMKQEPPKSSPPRRSPIREIPRPHHTYPRDNLRDTYKDGLGQKESRDTRDVRDTHSPRHGGTGGDRDHRDRDKDQRHTPSQAQAEKLDKMDRVDKVERPDRGDNNKSHGPQYGGDIDERSRPAAAWAASSAAAAASASHESDTAQDQQPPAHSQSNEHLLDFNHGQDRDYRFTGEDDGYKDYDYRPNVGGRKRRMSPTEDEWGERDRFSGRGGRFGGRGGGRGGFIPKRRFDPQQQLCKFFREGYCRDGANCAYSHNAEQSFRRPELCKFYASGFCKKGVTCNMLHGEFPCKAFHKGECTRDPCQFSHVPLNDYTRPIFQKMLEDDEILTSRSRLPMSMNMQMGMVQGYQAAAAAAASRRRVLLPGGPPSVSSSATAPAIAVTSAPIIHVPLPATSSNGTLPPPSVVVPTLASKVPDSSNVNPALIAQIQASLRQQQAGYFGSPVQTAASPKMDDTNQAVNSVPIPTATQSTPAFNINAMLAQLAEGAEPEESPSSPPPMPSSIPLPEMTIPETKEIAWRLLPVKCQNPYSGFSGVDFEPSSSDPRKQRVLASLFDATTQSLFSSTSPTASGHVPSTAADSPPAPINKEASAASRDPRRRNPASSTATAAGPGTDPAKVRSSSWMPQIA